MAAVMKTLDTDPRLDRSWTTRPALRVVPAPPTPLARHPRPVSNLTYRRRRFVAVVLGVGMVFMAGKAGMALGGSTSASPGRGPSIIRYVVEPGDSLWSVAGHLAPGVDPRPIVDDLSKSRHGAPLLVGETIEWQR